jgi:hypothetical protein
MTENTQRYDVTLKSKGDDNTWTMTWNTYSFRSAEFLTLDMLRETNQFEHNEIINISKDYGDPLMGKEL